MAPLLHLIRFPTMTRDEFISVVGLWLLKPLSPSSNFHLCISVPTHVLSDSQVGQIIRKPEESPFSRELRKRMFVSILGVHKWKYV
jgi:hypothetical protein